MSDKSVFEGKDIGVTWDGRLCIHVTECGQAKGNLSERGEWTLQCYYYAPQKN